jgi:NAD(P)-dependent dehydrogenase (short-subunit alcohol dehydrogenase family)
VIEMNVSLIEKNSMRLKDKVALITGAGSGIGRETALLFAREGAKVVVADINEPDGQETAAQIVDNGLFVRADVSDWEDSRRLVDRAVEVFGGLDILFNNAGIDLPYATTVVDTEESDWDRIINVNLKGVFSGIRHALPVMMAQQSGVIISTASRAGLGATPGEAAYCASKGGVVSLTRQLAVDYAPYNIRVNCVCPGGIDKPTLDRQAHLQQIPGALAQRNQRIMKKVPLNRMCTPKDVADAALYLASEESAFVTGTALVVDGGGLAL